MVNEEKSTPERQVMCEDCQKYISESVAMAFEAHDYVYYFCGPSCFDHWTKNSNS